MFNEQFLHRIKLVNILVSLECHVKNRTKKVKK